MIVEGINVLGVPEPASVNGSIQPPDELKNVELSLALQERLGFSENAPDILAVHNPKTTENLVGKVPVILNGHTHKLLLRENLGSIVIHAGTTGAAKSGGSSLKVIYLIPPYCCILKRLPAIRG